MALQNGHSDAQERSLSPSQYLGKRKRTASVDSDTKVSTNAEIARTLGNALELMRRYDPSAIILRFPLPARDDDSRTVKKQRTGTTDRETDNIEYRILNAGYQSMDDLMEDVSAVKRILFRDGNSVNGTTPLHSSAKEQISLIWESLSNLQSSPNDAHAPSSPITNGTDENTGPVLPSSQVLSLRSQTEYGIRQLFSGLPINADSSSITGRDLPNGFELTEVLAMDKNNVQSKDARKFGDVFAAHRNVKSLEMPRAINRTSARGNNIGFIPPFDTISSSTRNDFKFSSLSTSLWLRYAVPDIINPGSKERPQPESTKASTLFKSAFTTFAPSTDNSHSLVTDRERSQQWWRKHGRQTSHGTVLSQPSALPASTSPDTEQLLPDSEYEEMIAKFIPHDDATLDVEETEVLEEISELIETLVSHQAIRNLEVARGPSSASKPTKDEQNTYEMLRNQLQLLVSSLPPFAVAKLNGDQLDELNISTQILVSPPEFVGTAQVDDYTLKRNRAAQAATTASARNPAAIPARTAYATPASVYNAQARGYNAAASAYATRPGLPVYNTPRVANTTQTGAYTQPQYRNGGPAVHTPSIQQFQRPMSNGYGSAATPTPQTSYLQRPAQPGYQQKAQDSIAYNRGESLTKTMTNGDAHYQQRQYASANNIHSANALPMSGQPRATEDAIKQLPSAGLPQQRTGTLVGSAAATS